MRLSKKDELEFVRLFKLKHGVPPNHASIKFSQWNVSVWNDDDICSIVAKPSHVMSELDALWAEIASTDRNTVVRPVLSEYRTSAMQEPILYQKNIDNILTNLGMKNMAQLSTADSVKTNTHCYVGDSATPEDVGDDQLGNQLAAKAFDSDGDRETVDQQERYAMAFFRSDFVSDVILKEAGIGTGTTPPTDILTAHVTFADKPIGAGQTMTVQITVTHKNGTS
ncbi:MAG: hypothetical protein K5785_01040 [Nitrosarchaeum sp.]|nr:hypothetical protein [Nitrosarchaeum sp.]